MEKYDESANSHIKFKFDPVLLNAKNLLEKYNDDLDNWYKNMYLVIVDQINTAADKYNTDTMILLTLDDHKLKFSENRLHMILKPLLDNGYCITLNAEAICNETIATDIYISWSKYNDNGRFMLYKSSRNKDGDTEDYIRCECELVDGKIKYIWE